MSLAPGIRVGHYEILAPIGAGGMGEVYRARDTRLKREVALKVLPDAFAGDPDRMARFQREAEALAALNHPNIAQIYGVEERALAMELVDGKTLAGPLPLETALTYARQIAGALEAAHEKGIIHRDLKPANIKVTPQGVVKVLDFGLAAIAQASAGGASNAADSPTLTISPTVPGMILGTAAYMSPEQARGKPVDKRADIWAFGVVLYEMLTGQRLFEGETISDTLIEVATREPDWDRVPKKVRRLLRRCLEKDPKKRLRDIGDVESLLEDAPQEATVPPAEASAPSRSRLGLVASIAVAVLAVALAAVAFIHFRETPPETPVLRTTILPPDNTTLDFTNGLGLPALSPDGKRIVFGARTSDGKNPLRVRSLDGLTAQPLAGTDGATFPFWSPDSRYIAFFADGKLKKIDASGGPAIALANAPRARGGSWSSEGVIVFDPGPGGLERVSSAGGASTPLLARGRLPWFLPDARHFLYQNILAASGGTPQIVVGSLDGAPSKTVGEASSNAIYAQGYLLYVRDGTLMTQPFDTKRLATTGEASPLAEQVQSVLNSRSMGAFSVSATGLLAYRAGADERGGVLTWFDRSGKPGPTVGEQAVFFGVFRFSPDRKSLAAGILNRANTDIWTYDVSRGIPTRLTTDAAYDDNPVWSPDGRSIAFDSNRKGHYDLYRRSANGAGADELLYADDVDKFPTSWSVDGKFLLFNTGPTNPKTGADIWALPLTPEKPGAPLKPVLVLQTPFPERDAQFSPDGKWIAYASIESQRPEIYVTQFPPPLSGAGGKRQISTAGGLYPQWRQDGREIFYSGLDRRLMAAEVAVKGGAVEVGQVRALFGPITTWGSGRYDVSADGQRFLIVPVPEAKSSEPLTLIQNWTAGLKK
jgi:serine/threonine protein kinase/Tol biopolymer transport system component